MSNPRCRVCKDNFFEFDYNTAKCVMCSPIDYEAEPYIPGVSLADKARYAEMDKIGDIANGDN